MGGKRILSDAQLDEMAALREKGWGIDRIAAHFSDQGTKISAATINWQCMRVGADAPLRLRGRHTQAARPYGRASGTVRPFSPQEDAELVRLDQSGIRVAEICRRMGRRSSSIRGRLLTLARIDARREEANGRS